MPKKTFFNLPREKRERVIQTLIKHFAHKPYARVDVQNVAEESRVSKGSMYQYFENKKDMYFYAIEVALKRYLKLVEEFDFKNISFFEYLKKSLNFYWKFLLTDKDACLLIEKTALYDDSPFKEEVEEMYHRKSREILREIVVKNQKAGFIRRDIDPEILTVFIEGASWNLKKALLRLAQEKGIPLHQLPTEVIEKAQNDFLKLLKDGIKGKEKS